MATFTAVDAEGLDIAWDLSGDDAEDFTITSQTGTGTGTAVAVVTFNVPPNFEAPADEGSLNRYEFTVEASDGARIGTWDYAVTVTDVNERPRFTGTVVTTFVVDEHNENEANRVADLAAYTAEDAEDAVAWSLTGTDSGAFDIDATSGVLTFKDPLGDPPDFEAPDDSDGDNVYTFTVVAADNGSPSGATLTATRDVTVTVEDVEEQGTITVDNLTPAVSDTISFGLSDPDDGVAEPVAWEVQARSSGDDWRNIGVPLPVTLTVTYTVTEAYQGDEIQAVAVYTDRRGGAKRAESSPTAAVTADPAAT